MPRNTWHCGCGRRNSTFRELCECGLPWGEGEFLDLVDCLRGAGYHVTHGRCRDGLGRATGRRAEFRGAAPHPAVYGEFGTHGTGEPSTNGHLVANHRHNFWKVYNCPLRVPLPRDGRERADLLGHLEVLGSRAGLELGLHPHRVPGVHLPHVSI